MQKNISADICISGKEEYYMEAKLLGVAEINFSNTNGEKIVGTNIFVAFKDNNCTGLRTEKFFLKEEMSLPEGIKLNDMLDIAFDYRGKIESIDKA